MEIITYGTFVKKGQTVKIKIPHVEEPIEAKVLDIIEYQVGGNSIQCECIMYAQNRLFRASSEFNWSIESIYDDVSTIPEKEVEVRYYSNLKYEGIIAEYCIIPDTKNMTEN